MNRIPRTFSPFAIGIFAVVFSLPVQAQKSKTIPDFTAGGKIPKDANHDWNLGPTGARGWIHSYRMETTEARQILITKVDKGSPADGKLQPNDVILGVDGKPFAFDPRVEFGRAIGKAEATNGRLSLSVWRKGKTGQLILQLDRIGRYSESAPFNCPKSKRIFEEGCAELANRMKANPKAGNPITRSYNTLALLASGKNEYLPIIKQQVAEAAKYSDVQGRSLCSWYYGPINLLIAEYTLATGDKTHLGNLKRISMEIVYGQSAVGSWGHRFSRPDGRLNGYGMMNAPGLPLTVSLILARKAGVSDPNLDKAIERSTRMLRFYAGKGCVPYGDHHPWMETHDDNGKNGVAAIMFNLLEDREAAEFFSRMSVASHSGEREMGHTGNFFNMLWAMPGVALSGPNACGAWMKEYGWYYDLARKWDGTFPHQGPAEPKKDRYNSWDATGAYLLAYAQPMKSLYITGKNSNVVPQVDKSTAADLVADGRSYSHRQKLTIYADRSESELLNNLKSWSPIVRERAARALARKEDNSVPQLIAMLKSSDLYAQLGACQALVQLKAEAAPAVPQLQKTLTADDLWLRIKAADALAAIGDKARVAVPDLLAMLVKHDRVNDPRNMQQRYLCFALFDQRGGLLRGSLDGVDREALYQAVRAGLNNEDGRARGVLANVYKKLSYEGIEPLLPAIHRAVVEPAPSGIMFADGVRLSGLEILAQHKIEEAMPLCLEVMELDRWGSGKRIPKCLAALQQYGGAAKDLAPKLASLEKQLKDKKQVELLRKTIDKIKTDSKSPQLRPLPKSE